MFEFLFWFLNLSERLFLSNTWVHIYRILHSSCSLVFNHNLLKCKEMLVVLFIRICESTCNNFFNDSIGFTFIIRVNNFDLLDISNVNSSVESESQVLDVLVNLIQNGLLSTSALRCFTIFWVRSKVLCEELVFCLKELLLESIDNCSLLFRSKLIGVENSFTKLLFQFFDLFILIEVT